MPYPATVSSGDPVDPAWGNAVRDQLVFVFDNSTARSSAIASPTEGMVSYLKDTDALEVYTGSAWQRPRNFPWGVLDYKTGSGSYSAITSTFTDIPGLSSTATVAANRRVTVTASVSFSNSTASAVNGFQILEDGVVVNLIQFVCPNASNVFTAFLTGTSLPSAGSHTWKVQARAISGSVVPFDTGGYRIQMWVEDVGPA